jgi:hypothetical protein
MGLLEAIVYSQRFSSLRIEVSLSFSMSRSVDTIVSNDRHHV